MLLGNGDGGNAMVAFLYGCSGYIALSSQECVLDKHLRGLQDDLKRGRDGGGLLSVVRSEGLSSLPCLIDEVPAGQNTIG